MNLPERTVQARNPPVAKKILANTAQAGPRLRYTHKYGLTSCCSIVGVTAPALGKGKVLR